MSRLLPIAGKLSMIVIAILVASLFSAPRAMAGEDPLPEGLDIKHSNPPFIPPPIDSPWESVWVDDFDDGQLDGWKCRAFTQHDVVELVPDGDGWCLHAASRDDGNGCGFVVNSPDLAAAGLNFFRTYRIDFRFMVPEACNLGTTVLRSQGVTLLMDEVNPISMVAQLGWAGVEDEFHRLGQIDLNEWNQIRMVISPILGRPTWSRFRIFLNGRDLGVGEAPKAPWTDISLFHPPFEISEAAPPSGELNGGGFWDDFAVYMREDLPGGGRGVKITPTAAPNPANPATTIRFDLTQGSLLTLDVFAVDGRRVTRLWNGWKSAGPQSFLWNGTDASGSPVSSGVYYGLVSTPHSAHTVRMTILK